MINILNPFTWFTEAPASTVGGGADDNSQMPWYVTFGIVIVGGALVFYAGKKVVNKFIK